MGGGQLVSLITIHCGLFERPLVVTYLGKFAGHQCLIMPVEAGRNIDIPFKISIQGKFNLYKDFNI